MTIKVNEQIREQVKKDIERTFGDKKVDKVVLTTLEEILIRLDNYIQGANIFIGNKLIEDEGNLLKPWIELGNRYVKNLDKVMKKIESSDDYRLPEVKDNESVDDYLKRLNSQWPRLGYALKSKLFPKLEQKHNIVKQHLKSIMTNLDAGWYNLAVGSGNTLTTDKDSREEWRNLTYENLGESKGEINELMKYLKETFVTLILTEPKKVADYLEYVE